VQGNNLFSCIVPVKGEIRDAQVCAVRGNRIRGIYGYQGDEEVIR
jgi:hypothetical protein